jgi:hypothetical protein
MTALSNDYHTWTGANYLADKIRAYWERKPFKGLLVRIEQMENPNNPDDRRLMFIVRSNMINGFPPWKREER